MPMKLLLLVVTIILCNENLEDKDYINPEKNNKVTKRSFFYDFILKNIKYLPLK